jgi:hypothetical protein
MTSVTGRSSSGKEQGPGQVEHRARSQTRRASRVKGTLPVRGGQGGDDPRTQRRVVDACFAAAHGGDFEALVALLDPEVVLRGDLPDGRAMVVRGAAAVAR